VWSDFPRWREVVVFANYKTSLAPFWEAAVDLRVFDRLDAPVESIHTHSDEMLANK